MTWTPRPWTADELAARAEQAAADASAAAEVAVACRSGGTITLSGVTVAGVSATIDQAKALAFDCIQAIEQQQVNLQALQARIQELQNETTETPKKG